MAESKMDRSRYPSHPAQVRSARHHAEQVLRDWGVGDSTTDAVLYVAA